MLPVDVVELNCYMVGGLSAGPHFEIFAPLLFGKSCTLVGGVTRFPAPNLRQTLVLPTNFKIILLNNTEFNSFNFKNLRRLNINLNTT